MARKCYSGWLRYVYLLIHGLMLLIRNLSIIYTERKKIGKGPLIIVILLLFVPHLPVDVLCKSLENGIAY